MDNTYDLISGTRSQLSALELKRLLVELKEYRPDICVRYRLMGEMWHPTFMKIAMVTERGILLTDEMTHKLISLSDLNMIIQFEIDNGFREYQPHFHYDVIPSQEL